jgi:hypothetical protein
LRSGRNITNEEEDAGIESHVVHRQSKNLSSKPIKGKQQHFKMHEPIY